MSKTKHPKAELYMADREKGMTYREIAEKHGVSKQAVAQVCGSYSPNYFRPRSEESVVYPNIRQWMNQNKITNAEMIRRMGSCPTRNCHAQLSRYLRGEVYPTKQTIDKLIEVTGLSYEELWER